MTLRMFVADFQFPIDLQRTLSRTHGLERTCPFVSASPCGSPFTDVFGQAGPFGESAHGVTVRVGVAEAFNGLCHGLTDWNGRVRLCPRVRVGVRLRSISKE